MQMWVFPLGTHWLVYFKDNHAVSTIAGTSVALLWMGLYCFGSDPSKCLWDDSTGSADMYNSFAAGEFYFHEGAGIRQIWNLLRNLEVVPDKRSWVGNSCKGELFDTFEIFKLKILKLKIADKNVIFKKMTKCVLITIFVKIACVNFWSSVIS